LAIPAWVQFIWFSRLDDAMASTATATTAFPSSASAGKTMLKVSGLRSLRRHPGGQGDLVRGPRGRARQPDRRNGAGKTTTLKAITGTQPAAAGEIEFTGRNIKGQGPWDLVRQGW
jgi:branched-chain amino acid transport system ATP-binding protein